jgi:putative chitinase
MDILTLLKIVPKVNIVNQMLVDGLNETFEKYQINTQLRQCHFLAQVLHESAGFVYTKELATGEAYEFRKDLGNTEKGDGVKYKGRGYIQITGKSNYSLLSKAFGVDFIKNPKLLEENPHAIMSAGWYWDLKQLNILADNDDILTITKRVNGGLNGFEDRQKWLKACKYWIK